MHLKQPVTLVCLGILLAACASAARSADRAPTSASPVLPVSHRSCAADFDSMYSTVQQDYAGFRSKAQESTAALAVLTDSIRAYTRAAADPAACTAALQRWIAFFGDPHLQVWEPRPQAASSGSTNPGATPAEDPRRPLLQFPDENTAVLRLPDFGDRYKPAIDSLVDANRAQLLATPYLVVDVRGNGGGWTGSYEESIIPLVYTDPILVHGMEAWASEGNIAYARALLASDRAEGIKQAVRALLPRMEANRDQFVTIMEGREIRLDTVHPMPRAVAVLVDRGCASTCEQFVLDARQSRKVTVIGTENTGGFLDYGNVRRVSLPSGRRVFQVPTARSRRLPETPLDLIGITPEVQIPSEVADPVEFARRYIQSAGGMRR
jgi:hypothetical protein